MIKVEKSSLDDLREIYEIEKSVFKNYWSELSLNKELENKNFNLNLVCRLNNEIIGYFFSKSVKNEYHILNFALKKNYQHRGFGKFFFNIIHLDCLNNSLHFSDSLCLGQPFFPQEINIKVINKINITFLIIFPFYISLSFF